jgi:sulfite exporter TauE/SafE
LTAFSVSGALVGSVGLAVLIAGLRTPTGEPKRAAMMIGGMMIAAFGLLLAGFAIAWQAAAPLDLNSEAAQ